LELDERVQSLAADEKLSASHAQTLLALKNNDEQFKCAEKIIEDGMSVRAAEAYVAKFLKAANTNKKAPPCSNEQALIEYKRAASDLQTLFGSKVNILHGKKKGKIEIEYYSPEELDRLLCLFRKLV
jgi:ParB family chromosome partitioning protein